MRTFVSIHMKDKMSGQLCTDVWMTAEAIDVTLEEYHQRGGFQAVDAALRLDDRLESWLARVGAEVAGAVGTVAGRDGVRARRRGRQSMARR